MYVQITKMQDPDKYCITHAEGGIPSHAGLLVGAARQVEMHPGQRQLIALQGELGLYIIFNTEK